MAFTKITKERTRLLLMGNAKDFVIPKELPCKLAPVPHTIKDRTGTIVGNLYIVGFVHRHLHRKADWLCYCKCGNFAVWTIHDMLFQNTRTCSRDCPLWEDVHSPKQSSMTIGDVFDRATVIDLPKRTRKDILTCKCRCLCGNEFVIAQAKLSGVNAVRCCKRCHLKMDDPKRQKYVQDKLLKHITTNRAGCWLWNGKKSKVNILLFEKEIHRVAYIAWKGDVPYGTIIVHECGNTKCVNPDHMRIPKPSQWRLKW